jgi:hypothetical protein
MEGEGEGSYVRRPVEGEREGSYVRRPMEGNEEGSISPLSTSPPSNLT